MATFLAQYSIRSKQQYIFRTNRLREVTGASALIAGAFDRLMKDAEGIGLNVRKADAPFSLEETLKAFEQGSLQVAELFQGGGNDTFLMDSEETFRRVNEVFTGDLLVHTPGMIPLCVGVPISEKHNYEEDYLRLVLAAGSMKRVMTPGTIDTTLPFAMMDAKTRQAFQTEKPSGASRGERFTAESLAKQNAYADEKLWGETAGQLDDLLGEGDSMLAIVHADGNNMGRKLQALLQGKTDYDSCVAALRSFSGEIDQVFVEQGDRSISQEKTRILEQFPEMKNQFIEVRSVISDGDDYTFICNARWALRLTLAYLEGIQKHAGYSACAGICIFHRHYPFARAYDLAEQACESAKKKVHTEARPDQNWIDFHYLHGGMPNDLEETREEHGTQNCMLRPWRCDDPEDPLAVQRLMYLGREMVSSDRGNGRTTRTNLKTLGAALETDRNNARLELNRIYYRVPALQQKLSAQFPEEETLLKAIYDLSEVYDLWFEGRESHV